MQNVNMPGTTSGQAQFATVPKADIPRSSFNRNHGYKATFNAGDLVPCFVDEVLPGDTFNLKFNAFARMATPLTPFMDNLYLDTFFFFVPCRLVWNNWEKFNGQQENPGDSTSFVIPQQVSPVNGYAVGSLQDYFTLPTTPLPDVSRTVTHNALPLRAYNLIWNQWFRDQNLQNSVTVDKGDGPDNVANYVLKKRGKRHDYFTSSLPWPQKGPAVSLPLGTTAPIVGNNADIKFHREGQTTNYTLQGIGSVAYIGQTAGAFTGNVDLRWGDHTTFQNTGLVADLSTATAATINQLRQAFQIQKLYERDARGGTRYTEIIQAHFGVISDDARLQRPEYLGGGSTPIIVNPIAQTSAVPSQPTPQGNLAAIGTASLRQHGFVKSFTEHGYIIGLLSVRGDLNYQQGLDKMWSRSTRFDFYWPALSHIGEQAVLNQEIYAGTSSDTAAFGYQERFAEYRYKPSKVVGQFRSTYAQTLDSWHLAQKFTSLPALNATFIEENPPVSRVIAVPTAPQFLLDGFYNLTCARPMPVRSVPGLIDHF